MIESRVLRGMSPGLAEMAGAFADRQHDVAMLRLNGTVDQQGVALVDADVDHRVAFDPVHVRGIRVADQVVIEVDALARVVTGRGSKTRRDLPAAHI